MRKFAISDIHGCIETFIALLDKIAYSTQDELYLLGDYIDRGPDSKGIIDFIWKLDKSGHKVSCLRGNHEQMLLDGLENTSEAYFWQSVGGRQTLQSFSWYLIDDIPPNYINWIENLDYYFEVDEYILVHAGLNFRKENPLEDKESQMWIRRWYEDMNRDWLGERIVVHGHTPVKQGVIQQMVEEEHLKKLPALDIDNGCVYDRTGEFQLCAFDMTNRALFFQKNIEPEINYGPRF